MSASRAKPAAGPSVSELRDELHAAGLRSTGPRLAVLRYLHSAAAPVSHPDIVREVAPLGFDRATLYRNLIDIAEAGLASRVDLGDHVWRFELKRERPGHRADHAHLVCTGCGEVSCLTDLEVKVVPLHGARMPKVKELEIQLRGRCARCA